MKNSIFEYHINDSRNINHIIKKKIVDVIITSPPYWNLKNYDVDNQIGFGQSYEKYLEDLITILDNCKHILKDKGSLWIIADSFKKSGNVRMLPFEIVHRLQDKGWHLQDIIIWQKDKTLPWSSKGKLRNIFEYILFFTKSGDFNFFIDELREVELKEWWPKYPERYNPKGKVPSRVWKIPIPMQGWGKTWVRHFCPFPPLLIEKILLLTTKRGNVVLDPFAGSGSVLAQADVMGRLAIGFDLNSEYKKMYSETVLPIFKELWTKNKKESEDISKKRRYLKKIIPALRKLKYPISLYKELLKKYPEIFREVNFIIADDKKELTYYFVFNELINDTSSHINEIMQIGKMRKFSLKPVVNISLRTSLPASNFFDHNYLYENGITNYYSKKIDIKNWLKARNKENEINEKIPSMISNIKVAQKDHLINS